MAKDYGRRNSTRHKGGVSKQLMLVLVSFLLGYLGASVFDLTSLSNWFNTQIIAKYTGQVAPTPAAPQVAQLPKPKFEFYTLLASERAAASAQVASGSPVVTAPVTVSGNAPLNKNTPAVTPPTNMVSAEPLPAATVPIASSKGSYMVQVASFKSKQEAERVKASLSLKGFMVSITAVTQQQTNWYRVVLGPFPTRDQAEKAQIAIARSEHIVGMIRRMDA